MHRISEVVGKPIISAENGDKLGSVSDALLDVAQVRIVGLVVGGGLLGEERVLPFGNVQTLGGDTVVARSSELIPSKIWLESGARATRSSVVSDKPVVTTTGRRVGAVSDLLVDQDTGTLVALEVGTSGLGGLRKKRSRMGVSPDIRIGPDAVVVPESALEEAQGSDPEGELSGPDDATARRA